MFNENQEVWKIYPEYPWIEVSNLGRVRTKDRWVTYKNGRKHFYKGHVLKQWCNNKNGYMYITLSVNGNKFTLLVHRMVATCFIPNPNNYPEINHKDCNRANNNVDNLEWCTSSYNNQYREKYGEAKGLPVFAANLETLEILCFPSRNEASRQLGVSVSSVDDVIKGRCGQAKGYLFTENEDEITKEKMQRIKAKMRFLGGVISVNYDSLEVSRFESQHEASRKLGVWQQDIYKVARGKLSKVGGCWFCYADSTAVEKTRAKFGDEVAKKVEELMGEA